MPAAAAAACLVVGSACRHVGHELAVASHGRKQPQCVVWRPRHGSTTTSSSAAAAGSYDAAPEGDDVSGPVVAGVAMFSLVALSPYGVLSGTSATMYCLPSSPLTTF